MVVVAVAMTEFFTLEIFKFQGEGSCKGPHGVAESTPGTWFGLGYIEVVCAVCSGDSSDDTL